MQLTIPQRGVEASTGDPVDVDLSVFKGYFLYARQVAT